ncbi:leucyl/phenylalanyl-tRNA--protein transferase [Flavobacterium sp. J372]|uniref:leucyl/phenylalanyl-tRNA--protein transferase n=1 Tax=Flavobacterium sp. J372 TaxID=2898436 RepID=UPI002151270B|nr:leucyl/phenylalanyl-tRNA--protein transferase [Flavobacterium sp. J372]MCR5860716.1 leucyl/phenylalanyl-tRNA--protein transferase [Flavobacterium sp. J372]
MYFLTRELYFPNVEEASPEGLVAIGGDLSPERLLLAYRNGIFPWFEDDEPILWWSPPERMVLFFNELKISKSMRNILNRGMFTITCNKAFREVITACRRVEREGQDGTWITDDMVDAYCRLHELGVARSYEVWYEDKLVGGLYGVDMGHIFCGESMFSLMPNASKVAFIKLSRDLQKQGYRLLDCQVHNSHLESLGAREIPRKEFIRYLRSI